MVSLILKERVMKKSIIVASLVLLGSTSLVMANDAMKDWFIGGEFGGMGMKIKTSGTDGTTPFNESDTLDTSYETLKMGKYFDFGRVYGAFSLQNKKDSVSSHSLGVGYDYLIENQSDFTPFVGVNIGYTKADIGIAILKTAGLDKPDGFYYGVGAGVLYPVADNLEVELGARYVGTSVDDNWAVAPASIKVEAESFTQYYIGLNYRF
jgi:opacity protein-like surface antigen